MRGFTLIEVLLTLVVLLIAFFPLIQMLSSGVLFSGEASNSFTAMNLASQKMEQIKNTSYGSILSEGKAVISDYHAFSREVIVTEPASNLKNVQVKVYWTSGGKELCVTLETLIANY